jgi:hypothetical protein
VPVGPTRITSANGRKFVAGPLYAFECGNVRGYVVDIGIDYYPSI